MQVALESFTKQVVIWNKKVYGNILYRKKRLMGRLDGIQRKLLQNGPKWLFKLEERLQ